MVDNMMSRTKLSTEESAEIENAVQDNMARINKHLATLTQRITNARAKLLASFSRHPLPCLWSFGEEYRCSCGGEKMNATIHSVLEDLKTDE